jgi:hypothetical protein
MDKKPFEQMDQEWMNRLKDKRESGVSPELMRGFSASVEAKIEARTAKKLKPFLAPMMIPAFAVMLVASLVIFKNPVFQTISVNPAMEMMLTSTADVADEIAAFQQLGLWGEEDQEELGVSDLEVVSE